MKSFFILIGNVVLCGCVSGQFFPKVPGPELAYKCKMDPYGSDCLQPPAIFKSS